MGFKSKITARYGVALGLVACVMLLTYGIFMHRISQSDDDASIINIAGQQRMLSQRVALMADQLFRASDDTLVSVFVEKLDRSVATMRRNHATLTGPAGSDAMTSQIAKLYEQEGGINQRMARFLSLGTHVLDEARGGRRASASADAARQQLMEIARNGFLGELDLVVARYEANARQSIAEAARLEALFLLLGLSLLLIEVFFIFRPMANKIADTIEELENANDELREFSFRISHDLRAPVASSLGMVNVASDALEDEDYEHARFGIERVGHAMRRLDALILDVRRISGNRQLSVEAEPVELPILIQSVLEKLAGLPGIENVQIHTELALSDVVVTKRFFLEQILENLISNSVKYADPGKSPSTIDIAATKRGGKFEIVVRDNGRGIAPEYHAQIFGMFKRFHSDAALGSGLGLYLVKQNARVLNGSVEYEPLSDGSQFTVSIAA